MQKVILKQLGGVEDLLLDANNPATVTQQRSSGPVTVTKINSATIPHAGKPGDPGFVSIGELIQTAVDAIEALASAGVVNLTTNQDIGGNKSFTSSEYLKLPSGTTLERPVTGSNSMIRYNEDLNEFEGYKGGNWGELGGGAKGGVGNKAFFENPTEITVSYTISAGANAGSFGPITVNDLVEVTVPDGSVWTIV